MGGSINDEDYNRENYKRSIRANRAETIKEIKRELGFDSPSRELTTIEAVGTFLTGVAMLAGLAYLLSRCEWDRGMDYRHGESKSPETPAVLVVRPATNQEPIDQEMRDKYNTAFKYARDCGPRMSNTRYCKNLEKQMYAQKR